MLASNAFKLNDVGI